MAIAENSADLNGELFKAVFALKQLIIFEFVRFIRATMRTKATILPALILKKPYTDFFSSKLFLEVYETHTYSVVLSVGFVKYIGAQKNY